MLPATVTSCLEQPKHVGMKRSGSRSSPSSSLGSTPTCSYACLHSLEEAAAASLIQARFRCFLAQKRSKVANKKTSNIVGTAISPRTFGGLLLLFALLEPAGAVDAHVSSTSDFAQRFEDVASAQAAAAAELALQATQGKSKHFGVSSSAIATLEKAAIAVLLRYAFASMVSNEHVDDVLGSCIGHFGAALTIGTACGVAARAAAMPLQALLHAAAALPQRAGPTLPPSPIVRRWRRQKTADTLARRAIQSVGGFSRSFLVTAVSAFAFDTLRAAEAISCSPDDFALAAAGLAAGSLAAAAAKPIDASIGCVRRRIKGSLPPDAATRMMMALDISSFCFLEAVCAAVGLTDPLDAL